MNSPKTNLDEIVTVEVQMSRRDFNRLTHVLSTDSYQLAAQRACFDHAAKFRSPFRDLDHKPYQIDIEIE